MRSGHYFKFERGEWIQEEGQPAQHFRASGLDYVGKLTLEQRNELDGMISAFVENRRDAEIAALRKRAEEAEATATLASKQMADAKAEAEELRALLRTATEAMRSEQRIAAIDAAMKCHGDKPTYQRREECQHVCDLRVQYVEGYEAGRAAAVAQWADHMKRMAQALANCETPNDRIQPHC